MDAEEKAILARDEFVKERLMNKQDFFKPIKRQKQKTFEDMSKKVVVKTSNNRELRV
jgi:hypothetical protein